MDGRLGRRRGRGLGPAARVAVSLAAVVLLLGAGGCGGEGEESTSGGRRVVVLGAESLAHLPVWVGMDRGIFAQYGFEVEWRVVAADAERLAQVCGGSAHAATVDLFTVVRAAARGRKCFAWAGNPVVAPGAVAVVARAGADTLAGLKGKRVGAAPGTPAEVVLRVLLRAAGIDLRTEVTLVPIGEEALVAGLRGGAVDAVAVSGAAVAGALAVPGAKAVARDTDTALHASHGLTLDPPQMIVQKAWADREPEQARKFLVAYYLAVERLKQQREEAAEVAGRHVASRDPAAIAGELDALVWHGLEAQRRLLADPPLQGLAREVTRLLRDEDGALGLASPLSASPALEEWVALDLLAP